MDNKSKKVLRLKAIKAYKEIKEGKHKGVSLPFCSIKVGSITFIIQK